MCVSRQGTWCRAVTMGIVIPLALFGSRTGWGQDGEPGLDAWHETALADVDRRADELREVDRAIWEFAEVGLEEHKSSALLVEKLRENGFQVETGVAGMPTAFVASFGSGKPIIGILAEYDALPGMSQA